MFTPAKEVKDFADINIYYALDKRIIQAANLGTYYLYLEPSDELTQAILNRPDKTTILDMLVKSGYDYYVGVGGGIKISWG